MTRLAALALLCLPGLASAQTFPALYDVAGVAANDVLNIRAEPTASAGIVGTFAPDATRIEVVRLAEGADWGLVNSGESAGWVSMAYLARLDGQAWGDMPAAISCFGTEPFWAFGVSADDTARFPMPDGERAFQVTARVPGQSYPGDMAILAESTGIRATAIVSAGSCNDGMSDREYGLKAGLLLEAGGPPILYTGCCSLAD
ncbi:SH3 domain-containing protein [Sinisalibacter aestuarii]|uniref:SH3b domain-containing protein n=1 Tax=Sinisalibacter aestuarii TaxID=2949426 RepID=A0ABQ5LN40_9RHOB|nr:SH3 domain-containing protein [Sinisalibacter aestuarii]GKY86371.1 hypothetical protein STA1M1_02400 [Sinisalibacter aestuarii]